MKFQTIKIGIGAALVGMVLSACGGGGSADGSLNEDSSPPVSGSLDNGSADTPDSGNDQPVGSTDIRLDFVNTFISAYDDSAYWRYYWDDGSDVVSIYSFHVRSVNSGFSVDEFSDREVPGTNFSITELGSDSVQMTGLDAQPVILRDLVIRNDDEGFFKTLTGVDGSDRSVSCEESILIEDGDPDAWSLLRANKGYQCRVDYASQGQAHFASYALFFQRLRRGADGIVDRQDSEGGPALLGFGSRVFLSRSDFVFMWWVEKSDPSNWYAVDLRDINFADGNGSSFSAVIEIDVPAGSTATPLPESGNQIFCENPNAADGGAGSAPPEIPPPDDDIEMVFLIERIENEGTAQMIWDGVTEIRQVIYWQGDGVQPFSIRYDLVDCWVDGELSTPTECDRSESISLPDLSQGNPITVYYPCWGNFFFTPTPGEAGAVQVKDLDVHYNVVLTDAIGQTAYEEIFMTCKGFIALFDENGDFVGYF